MGRDGEVEMTFDENLAVISGLSVLFTLMWPSYTFAVGWG